MIASAPGVMIYFCANLVASWWFKKQTVVVRSPTEAEYRCLAHATAEVTYLDSNTFN